MIMAVTNGGVSNLEDRLSLISRMLEDAVEILRSTMSEVREEAKGEPRDGSGRPEDGPGRRPG